MPDPAADPARGDGPASILVTGTGGFVGGHAVAALATRWPRAVIHGPAFDITDADAVDHAVASIRPAVCLHLAAVAAIPEARDAPERAWSVNLGGTLVLARAILRHVPGCLFVFAGSADVYGGSFRSGRPVAEDAPLAPLNTYAATKAAADLALGAMAAADGLRLVRFRPFNHTGPGQRADFVVGAFARQLALIEAGRQDNVMRVGNLAPERDFLDVRDVVRAYAEAADPDRFGASPDLILNLASGTPRRIGDVLASLIAESGMSVEIAHDEIRARPNEIVRAVGSAHEAASRLGWSPRIPWTRTLADTLADWRQRVG